MSKKIKYDKKTIEVSKKTQDEVYNDGAIVKTIKTGDLDIRIGGKCVEGVDRNELFGILFAEINDLKEDKVEMLDLIDTLNNSLLGALARLDILEGN
jgi:hypothetical protein